MRNYRTCTQSFGQWVPTFSYLLSDIFEGLLGAVAGLVLFRKVMRFWDRIAEQATAIFLIQEELFWMLKHVNPKCMVLPLILVLF